jgi:recombination protein RecA
MPAPADREKALDTALAQIDRQFGKGSVMRLGDEVRVPLEVIPTGSIALDVALGLGGLPRGRVVEIYGPESSGKCMTADTYIWSDRGLETVAEIFDRAGQQASCTSRVSDVRELGLRVVNERGELETVAALTHNNRKPVLNVRLRSGRSVSVTHNHPLRVVSERGFIVWRKAGDIRPGDTVVSALFGADEAACGESLSEDEAVFLGYLVAEGSLKGRNAVRFTNWDPEVAQEYTRLAEQLFGSVVRHYDGKEHCIFDTKLRARLADEYGLEYVNAPLKTVPQRVRVAGAKVQRAFLSALFEGDGWIDPASTIGLGTASQELGRQVQLMLYGLGIPATLQTTFNQSYQRDYYSVIINPSVGHRFLELVGFRSQRRASQVQAHFRRSTRDPQFENVPHLRGLLTDLRDSLGGDREFDAIAGDLFRTDMELSCSRTRLAKIVAWLDRRPQKLSVGTQSLVEHLRELSTASYTYESVAAVEDGGLQPTFDLMVPDTHSFVANGVLSHNTTVALHAVANAQKAGGIAAFIDAEHALDPEYAQKLGVDTDALLVSQPDTGEQALEIADMLIRSGALDIIVIDSVAALVPRAEIEGEMGDSHVGLQARLMSQALRKLTGALSHSKTTAIFINQLREKIGVMFGCVTYDTRIALSDGSQRKIGEIVEGRESVEVLSYDPTSGGIVPRRVTNWFDNGDTQEFVELSVRRGATGRGTPATSTLELTNNHPVRTPGGWREAGEIIAGDRVMAPQLARLSDQQWQVVLGGLLGDAALSQAASHDGCSARFRLGHGARQADYIDWKAGMFGNIGQTRSVRPNGSVHIDLTPLPELAELREVVYFGDGKKHVTWDYLKALTPLALAIWYQDDASFTLRSMGLQMRTVGGSGRSQVCVEAMSPGSRERLRDHLRDSFGLEARLHPRGTRQMAVLTFTTAATARLHELIAPYVHPSMQYKLLPRFQGKFDVEPEFVEPEMLLMPARVVDRRTVHHDQPVGRYDIEVEGTHNYFADGVMVHNSPETTTGGKALKFYASIRLDVRRIETLKDGTEPVGNRTRCKVVKNKCLAEGTRVFDPTTGVTHRIEDIVDGRLPVHVVAMDKAGHLAARPVVSWFDQGTQDVVRVATRGAEITVTPDHRVFTENGWVEAGSLHPGDRIARPRSFGTTGDAMPVTADEARLLGYLIGDGYVGGKTPVTFTNTAPSLREDCVRIAAALGCEAHELHDHQIAMSHRPGEQDGVLELARRAGIWGKPAWEKSIPQWFFDDDVHPDLIGQMLFGLLESDGHVSVEQPGATRVGFTTTSEQLAQQIHWLLLRQDVMSSVRRYDPTHKRPSIIEGREVRGTRDCFEVRVTGSDNVSRFAEVVPTWGPRGSALVHAMGVQEGRRGSSQQTYLPTTVTAPVLEHLRRRGVSCSEVATLLGRATGTASAGLAQLLGTPRLRRDRIATLAAALDDGFLDEVLAEQVAYATVRSVVPAGRVRTFDLEVEEHHNLVAEDIVVHNCAPPFKQAEFDILYGQGISREGGLIDMGVEHGFVRKSGAWYTYEGDQMGQGKENARAFLKDNPDLSDEIEKKIKEKLGVGARLDDPTPPAEVPVEF